VVDNNIDRILARVEGSPLRPRQVQALADAALPPGRPWAWNQTIMDLGAVVCRPTPHCDVCPVEHRCAYRGVGSDPAIGSSGVSTTQSRFDGSDRQARGRLMQALQAGALAGDRVAAAMQRDVATSERLLSDLVRDGLVVSDGASVRLPG
jgi:A/G-specific adenine glycosylase